MTPVIVNQSESSLKEMRGLISFWASNEDIANRMVNAGAETIKITDPPEFVPKG
jgi:putative SOS response-associated peptidase YedK